MMLQATSSSSSPSSLKPAALLLMNAGKALAQSGERIIDYTTKRDLYGGAMSAAGAQIRNAGDTVALAAAAMRHKTATELVFDELRESATCLDEASRQLVRAVQEAEQDKDTALRECIGKLMF